MDRIPLPSESTIPTYWLPQTEILSILSVVLRFGSVLTAAAVVAVVSGAASEELLLAVTPARGTDRRGRPSLGSPDEDRSGVAAGKEPEGLALGPSAAPRPSLSGPR